VERQKPMTRSLVGISRVKDIDSHQEIRAACRELLTLLQPGMQVRPGAKVMVKVNLCLIKGYETGATLDPFVVRCFVEWLLEQYEPAEIILAEADATHLSADMAFRVLGWDRFFADVPRVRLLNLSADERVQVELDGLYFESLEMSRTYMEADYLVSFAKLKTHTLERITCSMKNLWGSWPEKVKITYHPYLDRVIYDLTKVRVPDLCLIDGIIAHEGAGPVDGLPKPLGLLLGGTDPVATDRVCAQVMGVNPRQVPHLRLAMKNGLGSSDYTLLGLPIEDVRTRFEFIPGWVRAWYALKKKLVAA
jgi:uncharacterized protein (DUF362 family)